jgi:hypothetical protein
MKDETKNNQDMQMTEKNKFSRVSLLALVLSIFALLFAVQEKIFSDNKAMKSINSTISNVIVPEMNKMKDLANVDTIYELKLVMVTLEKLRETSESDEIKMQVEQIMKQIEDLSIKALVHE